MSDAVDHERTMTAEPGEGTIVRHASDAST